jgi:transposase-like protein
VPRPRVYPPEVVRRVAEMYSDGMSYYEISSELGIAVSTARRMNLRAGGSSRPLEGRPPTSGSFTIARSEVERTVRLYVESKMSTVRIARLLGVTPQCVRERLIDAGVELRTLSEAQSLRQRSALPPGHYLRRLACGCGRDYMTVPLDEAHTCPHPIAELDDLLDDCA